MDFEEKGGYKPEVGFEEDTREPLVDISSIDPDSELWLIQWPHNELPDFQGKEISLDLQPSGCLATFEATSGKVYDVVSCAAQEPDATVFVSSASQTKIVGNISRRVSLVRFPEPQELEKQEAEKKSKRLHQASAGSSYQSATSTHSTKLRNSYSSRANTTSTHSSRHKSGLSEASERSSVKRRRQKHEQIVLTDRSTLDSGKAQSGYTFSGSP